MTCSRTGHKIDCVEEAKRVIRDEANALLVLADHLPERFEDAVELILNSSGRVVVSGIGKSGHIGRKISSTMASLGQKSFFLHPSEAQHGDLGMLDENDVLLLISYSGEAVELFPVLDFAKRIGSKVISISKSATSTLAKNSDVPLVLPDITEAGTFGIAPTVSSTNTLALGDALAMALLAEKGFTREQFKTFHPGGALGRGLTPVRDIMHREMPLIQTGDSMQNALLTMTSFSFGCVGVLGKDASLVGIITDGDLRRNMCVDLLAKSVDDVMTANPITICKDILASELLHLMEEAKITNIFVTDAHNIPLGIVHIHDLLQNSIKR